MVLTVQKWGNSLAVRIPSQIANQAHLKDGSEVDLTEESGTIMLDPVEKAPTLAELLEGMGPEHLHGEIDFGPPRGKEAW